MNQPTKTPSEMSLSELMDAFSELTRRVIAADEEGDTGLDAVFAEEFGELEAANVNKVDGWGWRLTKFKDEAAIWKREKDIAAKRQKQMESAYDRGKAWIQLLMERSGLTRLEGRRHKFSFRKGQPTLRFLEHFDLDELPDEFKRVTVEVKRAELRAALAEGREVPGVELEETQPTLVMR